MAVEHLLDIGGADRAVLAGRDGHHAIAEERGGRGLVPWADSGTSTTERASPRAERAALIAIMPHISPCAPALGLIATACMPVISTSQRPSSSDQLQRAGHD
jgi:hypothetical protein